MEFLQIMDTTRDTPKSLGLGSPSHAEVRQRLVERKAPEMSWRALAAEIGMPKAGAMLSRVAAGKQTPPPSLYKAVGLTPPVRIVEVPAGYGVGRACPACGQVHTTKTCAAKRKPRRTVRDRFSRWMMPGDW